MSVPGSKDLAAMPLLDDASVVPLPLLETGDHLTADEFLRRYEAMPGLKKAVLIDGVVYLPSSTRWNGHAVEHVAIGLILGTYWARTPGVQAGASATLRLDPLNVPQPDLAMIILPSRGGQARIDDDRYLAGAPELVCEISASTWSLDLNGKLRLYLRSRVREYVVWRVEDRAIDWFIERQGRYDPLQPDAQGVLKSEVFPGLWLDVPALMALDLPRALHTLDQGLATAEHVEFMARLARATVSAQLDS
jgi:Uma2 family endonuclease